MPHNLIQLVSEQTLPDILPALALEPAQITLLYSRETAAHCERIRRAVEKAGLAPQFDLREISDWLSLTDVGNVVRAAIRETSADLAPVVNFTCGTKLMAIGAFAAALNTKTPSFYFDTFTAANITDGKTGLLPEKLRDSRDAAARIEKRLTVEIVAAANGVEAISPGLDPEPLLPLALHLLKNPAERDVLAKSLIDANFDPKEPGEVADFLFRPAFESIISDTAAQLALDAGILEKRSGKLYFARPASLENLERFLILEKNGKRYYPKEWFAALAPLQTAINFFTGGWWELAVLDAARRSGQFRDLRWSVNISVGENTFEKDIVALAGLNLALFSCKRGQKRDRLVAALNELDSDARQIGGSYSKKYLCIALPYNRYTGEVLRKAAAQTRATLISPADKLAPENFLPRRGSGEATE